MKKKIIKTGTIPAAFHGECGAYKASAIPESAKRIKVGATLKIADSETTGNHHLVENAEGCEFYESDGIRYMKNSRPTNVKCVIAERHSTFPIPPGIWEFDPQQEFDYFTQSHRAVLD